MILFANSDSTIKVPAAPQCFQSYGNRNCRQALEMLVLIAVNLGHRPW